MKVFHGHSFPLHSALKERATWPENPSLGSQLPSEYSPRSVLNVGMYVHI